MKVSTKGRYGLRAMVDLVIYSKGECLALSAIAERQNISTNYLEQVFSALRKAGLVKSIKGAQGGYYLDKDPADISVGDVLRVLEGKLSIAESTEEQNMEQNTIKYCLKTMVWDKIEERINEVVDAITLEDLANEYKRINGMETLMYYI
ncbi:MAG: Rrf2 family transcriptional regulator [Clostridiaceae bacterium]|nr:Rrf2 family transcriptional regulator [Clostridiaceae bacterium]